MCASSFSFESVGVGFHYLLENYKVQFCLPV